MSISLLNAASQTGWIAVVSQINQHFVAMKTGYLVTGAATVMVAVPLVYQFQSMQTLKEEQKALREEIAASDGVSEEYAAWQKMRNEQARVEQLQDELEDKERLSEEVAALKADDAENKLKKMAELNDAKAKLEAAENEKEETERQIEFKRHQIKVINSMKHLGLFARIYATDHDDELPNNFEQIANFTDESKEHFKDTPLEGFEYFKHERHPSETEPNMILFREVEPRFDGTMYHRAYTFCDGSVQTRTSETSDFSDWEKLHTATLENQPQVPSDYGVEVNN